MKKGGGPKKAKPTAPASRYRALDPRLAAPEAATAAEHIIVHLGSEPDAHNEPQDAQPEAPDVSPYDAHQQQFCHFAADSGKDMCTGARHHTLLGEFEKRTQDGDWPNDTGVRCHWCCHQFVGAPVSLPARLCSYTPHQGQGGEGVVRRWEVSGCFCSVNCAAAYNFAENGDSDSMWETYALLNRMHEPALSDRILPAPPREALMDFGGYLSIDEFRALSQPSQHISRVGDAVSTKGSVVDTLRYPMAFVPQRVEEVNEADIAKPLRFIPIDDQLITRVKEKLALRRTKMLVSSSNTLDRVMNLQIEAHSGA